MAKDSAERQHFLHHRKFYWTVIVQTMRELSNFWIVVPDYTHTHMLTSSPHTPLFSCYVKAKWKWKSLSRARLCNLTGYTVHRILQAGILKWVAFPFSRWSPQPRGQTQVSCIGVVGGNMHIPRSGGPGGGHSAVDSWSSLLPLCPTHWRHGGGNCEDGVCWQPSNVCPYTSVSPRG